MVPKAAIGLPEDMIRQPLSETLSGYAAAAMASKAPGSITEAGQDLRVEPQLRELGAETAVWLPVVDTQSVCGALVLARCQPLPFANADADLLVVIADPIGLTLNRPKKALRWNSLFGWAASSAHNWRRKRSLPKRSAVFRKWRLPMQPCWC